MYADDHLSFYSGRTFPTHQYFSAQLGAGQLSLYNLLKAYSLLDTEVRAKILFPLHHCRKIRVWWITLLLLALRNLFLLHHQGRLLSGYQLCSRSAAATHEWGAGLWHAEVPHVWPGHQAAVQTRHGLSAGEHTHTSQQYPAEQIGVSPRRCKIFVLIFKSQSLMRVFFFFFKCQIKGCIIFWKEKNNLCQH